ncbi:WXG100 family type VII secretion target [Nocardia callitridis]|uniref:WXG100 family type VII secretion target n=1 Tax=Nocardia callitridis TaxID=648753 RepID=A0ABP9KJ12_9NOCA
MGEYESKQIPGGGEYANGWSHIEIKNAFGSLDTTNSSDAAGKYTDSATQFDQGIETFARSVTNSISESWEGNAAESAKDAIKRYTDDARQLPGLLSDLSNQINEAAKAIVDTRNAIPDYADHSWTARINPWRAAEENRSRNEVEQKARDAMHDNYVTRFADFDAKVPVLPPAVNPTSPPGDPAIVPGTTVNGPGPGPDGSSTPENSTGAPDSADANDQDGDGIPDDQAVDQPTRSQDPADNQTTTSSAGSPSADPGTPTSSNSPQTMASSTPSNAPSTFGPGPGPGAAQTPGAGRSLPGTPGAPTTGGPAAAAAATGRAGMPGMMGPGPGAPGKKGDESERKGPDYLVNQENTDELLGEIPKVVPGGVIGGDIPASDQPPTS